MYQSSQHDLHTRTYTVMLMSDSQSADHFGSEGGEEVQVELTDELGLAARGADGLGLQSGLGLRLRSRVKVNGHMVGDADVLACGVHSRAVHSCGCHPFLRLILTVIRCKA